MLYFRSSLLRYRRTLLSICVFVINPLLFLSMTAYAATNTNSAQLVKAAPASKLAIYPKHKSSAVVMALNNSQISAEIGAKVVSISVHVGQIVKKGTVLLKLDSTDYTLIQQQEEAVLRSLTAKIELAKYQLQRAQSLIERQAVSEELLKQRETELVILQAEHSAQEIALKQAQRNVDKCLIRAPYAAVVVEKLASVGDLASPGTPLMNIVDAKRNEVSAKVQQQQVALLETSENPKFVSRAQTFAVELASVTPVLDNRERTQEVRLTFKEKSALPGTSGELVWESSVPYLPSEYVVRREGILGVFLIRGGKAVFHRLVDAVEGRPAKMEFDQGELVVTSGRFRLQDGDAVKLD